MTGLITAWNTIPAFWPVSPPPERTCEREKGYGWKAFPGNRRDFPTDTVSGGKVAHHSIHVGTSGWVYDDWQGRFYPDDVKGSDRRSFYAEQFDTVEVNATFYRLPTQNM
ncbi:MAG: DUF72 domain-containing protein, partial [Desulfobacterales bacterium]|nr:DUF72 domain-containing protein [Desulfobacterales bacterium]